MGADPASFRLEIRAARTSQEEQVNKFAHLWLRSRHIWAWRRLGARIRAPIWWAPSSRRAAGAPIWGSVARAQSHWCARAPLCRQRAARLLLLSWCCCAAAAQTQTRRAARRPSVRAPAPAA